MTAIKRDGVVIGAIERTNGGNWFADRLNSDGDIIALGAFLTRSAAVAAVNAAHDGDPIVDRIRPKFLAGPPAGGQS